MGNAARDSAARIEIQITLTLEHEYERRGAFPELRQATASHINSQGVATHRVSIARAKELVDDAEAQRLDRAIPAKIRVAYGGAVRRGREAIARETAAGRAGEVKRVEDGDDDWPPPVRHNPAIQIGDGTCWHYLAAADVLLCEGILDADEIPGNPACPHRWRHLGFGGTTKTCFQAVRLGNKVAVTLLDAKASSVMQCVPLQRKVR